MKNVYFGITIAEKGKFYSYVLKVLPTDNILSRLRIPGIVNANVFPTKKQAAQTVKVWNDIAKVNGTYLFDSPKF